MCTVCKAERPSRKLTEFNRVVDGRSKPLTTALNKWMERYTNALMVDVRRKLRAGGVSALRRSYVKKVLTPKELERMEVALRDLFTRYGVSQSASAGRAAAKAVGRKWLVEPALLEEIAIAQAQEAAAQVLVGAQTTAQQLIAETVAGALVESPQISITEIGRRIQAEAKDKLSPARARAIARDRVAEVRTLGQVQAYSDIGIELVGWLAYPNDGRSGKREHWRMNEKSRNTITVAGMNGADESKWFRLPSGIATPYPKWSGLPIGESAGCRCNLTAMG